MSKQLNYTCPNCSSVDTQNVKVIHRDGYSARSRLIACPTCHGSGLTGLEGIADNSVRSALGAETCPTCNGSGKIFTRENVQTSIGKLLSPPKDPNFPTEKTSSTESAGCLYRFSLTVLYVLDIIFVFSFIIFAFFNTSSVPLSVIHSEIIFGVVSSVLSITLTVALINLEKNLRNKRDEKRRQYQREVYQREFAKYHTQQSLWSIAYQKWEGVWYCHRCNQVFNPSNPSVHVPVEQMSRLLQ